VAELREALARIEAIGLSVVDVSESARDRGCNVRPDTIYRWIKGERLEGKAAFLTVLEVVDDAAREMDSGEDGISCQDLADELVNMPANIDPTTKRKLLFLAAKALLRRPRERVTLG